MHRTDISGWVCGECRRWWGDGEDSEHMAGYCCATARECRGCGARMEGKQGFTACNGCRQLEARKKWEALELVEWNGEHLATFDSDEFFFDEESALEYVAENPDAMLVICEPHKGGCFDLHDWLADDLPEDADPDPPKEVEDAIAILNKWLTTTTFSWWPTGPRVVISRGDE